MRGDAPNEIQRRDPRLPLGEFWVQLFHLYIAFCGLAVLNVITGVFVNSAIKTREKDHETLMQNMHLGRYFPIVSCFSPLSRQVPALNL